MAHQNEPLSVDVYPPELLTRGFAVENATSRPRRACCGHEGGPAVGIAAYPARTSGRAAYRF